MAAKKDQDKQPEAMKTETHEETVPVNVGMDKDAMARAETQNRQVGVDDTKEIRETLHDAAEDQSKTVDIPVKLEGSEQLPEAAKQAIADKDKDKDAPARSGNTLAGMGGAPADPYGDDALREVTLNGQHYSWRKGGEGGVPKEAVEVWERAREANTP